MKISLDKKMKEINLTAWEAPEMKEIISGGDMPGDVILVSEGIVHNAKILFPNIIKKCQMLLTDKSDKKRIILSVSGGSGVGKSSISAVISNYFNQLGIGTYILSGDNYPHRIPVSNDAERLRIFRQNGVRTLVKEGIASPEKFELLEDLQKNQVDSDTSVSMDNPWLKTYQKGGREALSKYLGTNLEIDFDEVSDILGQFQEGANEIWLRRMGRDDTAFWYEKVDVTDVDVVILEWTHGNNESLTGIDIPIFLYSTPEETMKYRVERNRDGGADSPFIKMVLKIEQKLINRQAKNAKIIMRKDGSIITYDEIFTNTGGEN